MIADIHFDYKLALEAIVAGVDGLRLNPGNIGGKDEVLQVIKKASSEIFQYALELMRAPYLRTYC